MEFIRRQLFLPGRQPSWWILAPLAVGAVGWTALVLLGIVAVIRDQPRPGQTDDRGLGILICLAALVVPVLILIVLVARIASDWRTHRMRHAGRRLGLRPSANGRSTSLESYLGLSFFRFCGLASASGGPALEGEFEDVPVTVFDLGFRRGFTSPYGAQTETHRRVQTVAVVPSRGPYFFRGPAPCDRDRLSPGWASEVGFNRNLTQSSPEGVRSVLHAKADRELDEALPAEALADLARLDDLVVEGCGEYLLVYREGVAVAPERLEAFLRDVVRAAEAAAVLGEAQRPGRLVSRAPPPPAPVKLRPQILPVPGREPPLWVCALPLLPGIVLTALVWLGIATDPTIPEWKKPGIYVATGVPFLGPAGMLTAGLVVVCAPGAWRGHVMRQACRMAGMRARRKLSADETAALETLPLFAFARQQRGLSRWVLEGTVEGRAVRVFDLGFSLYFPERGGSYRSVQTVAAVSMDDGTGRFHAGPPSSPWETVWPHWEAEQGLLFSREVTNEDGESVLVVRMALDNALTGASAWGELRTTRQGLVVEGCPGLLLIYRHDRRVEESELTAFLRDVRHVLQARAAAAPEPPVAPAPAAAPIDAIALDAAPIVPPAPSPSRRPSPVSPRPRKPAALGWLNHLQLASLPGRGRSLTVGLPVVGFVALFVGLLIVTKATDPNAKVEPVALVIFSLVLLCGLLLLAAFCFSRASLDLWRASRMHAAGRKLGMHAAPWPSLDDLDEDYQGFPLFRFSWQCFRGVVWSMEGQFEGVPMHLFEYAYEGNCVGRRGQSRPIRHVQTVVALPGAGPMVRFYLGPSVSDWNDLEPGWERDQGLLDTLELSCADVPVPPVVHTSDGAALDVVFTPGRQKELAAYEGWVIECCRGTLLVYCHDHAVRPEDLPAQLEAVWRIAQLMRDVAGWTPPDEPHAGDDRHAPPSRNVRPE